MNTSKNEKPKVAHCPVPKTNIHIPMNKKEKAFDAIKMMREIRNKISSETQDMTFDELKAYIKQRLGENSTKLVGQQ